MKKIFKYKKSSVFFSYLLVACIAIASSIGFILLIPKNTKLIVWIIPLLFLLIAFMIIIWMINILKSVLLIDEMGIKYKSPLKNIIINWNRISNVKKTSYFGQLSYTTKLGSRWNITIKTKENKVFTIHYFLKNIEDLISEIQKHVKIDDYIFISECSLFGDQKSRWRNFFNPLRKITLRVFADNSGILIEGYPSFRGIRSIPWDTIKSIKMGDEHKGSVIIETTTENIPLNLNNQSEYLKLTEKLESVSGRIKCRQGGSV